jgi:hypothetical protein
MPGHTEQLLSHAIEAGSTLMVPHKYADDGAVIEYEPIDSLVRERIYIEPPSGPAMDLDYSFRKPKETQIDGELLSENKQFSRKKQVDGGWYEFFPLRPQPLAHAYNVSRYPAELSILDRAKNKNAGGRNTPGSSSSRGNPPAFPKRCRSTTWLWYICGSKKSTKTPRTP